MKIARLLVELTRAWLDVRFLRWTRDRQRPYRVFHGEKPRLSGYRRRPR